MPDGRTFYDMGAAGFWRDMIANSPRLNVSEYGARRDDPAAAGAVDGSFHFAGDSHV